MNNGPVPDCLPLTAMERGTHSGLMLKRVGRAQLLARPAYQLDFEHSTFQLAFRYAVTVRFWPKAAFTLSH